MTDGQSKKASLLEAVVNIAVGMVLAFATQEIVFRLYGFPMSLSVNLQMVCIFTVISLVRSFVLRRIFNYFTTHG